MRVGGDHSEERVQFLVVQAIEDEVVFQAVLDVGDVLRGHFLVDLFEILLDHLFGGSLDRNLPL